jgi:hypothetical protein
MDSQTIVVRRCITVMELVEVPKYSLLFFLIRIVGGEVQLGPLGTAATDWSIVVCPG